MARAGGYRSLLGNRRFLYFEASATASYVGYSVFALSVPWLALTLSGNFAIVGLALFVEFGIYALTFLAAPLVDRARDKRTVFLICYPLQAVAAASLGFSLVRRTLTIPLLLALVGLISVLWDFAWAAQNVAPKLLLDPDELFRGAGLGGLIGGVTTVAGYLAGAALLVASGPEGGMFLYAALLAVGAAFAALVTLPTRSPSLSRNYLSEFREGWQYFRRRAYQSLLGMGAVEVLRGFFSAAPALLITLAATSYFAASSSAYSALFVAWAVGGIAVGLVLGELNPRHRVGWILGVSTIVEGALVFVAMAFVPHLAFTAFVWAMIGIAGTAYLTTQYTFLRGAFPAEALGRITSNLYLFTGVSAAAGALVLGQLAQTWPPVAFGGLVAVGLIVVGLLVMALPSVRRLSF